MADAEKKQKNYNFFTVDAEKISVSIQIACNEKSRLKKRTNLKRGRESC
jgi:hypothetical protein